MKEIDKKTSFKESETTFRQVILIIDDEPIRNRLTHNMSKIEGLKARFSLARDLANFPEKNLGEISMIITDQFFDSYWGVVNTKEFLERLEKIKPGVPVIEISYTPSNPVFINCVGVMDTMQLSKGDRDNFSSWPKTAEGFINKLKWIANYAFQNADEVDNLDNSLENIGESFMQLISSFDRLTKDPNFPNLLKLLNVSENDFIFGFMSDNNLDRRKNFIHSSWQTVGHLMFGNSEEFYEMSLQRLKGSFGNIRQN